MQSALTDWYAPILNVSKTNVDTTSPLYDSLIDCRSYVLVVMTGGDDTCSVPLNSTTYNQESCTASSQCGTGGTCTTGGNRHCTCANNTQCGTNYSCQGGVCRELHPSERVSLVRAANSANPVTVYTMGMGNAGGLNTTELNAMLMTFILITSSLTMFVGVRAAKMGDKKSAFRWTMITAAGGILFAIPQLLEWTRLVGEGVRLSHNPWGNELFGATFFSISGWHLIHVAVGVIALVVIAARHESGRSDAGDIETMGLYWQFVVLLWMFVLPAIYLLNVAK